MSTATATSTGEPPGIPVGSSAEMPRRGCRPEGPSCCQNSGRGGFVTALRASSVGGKPTPAVANRVCPAASRNHDVEIVMADQRVLELRRQGGELGRRLDFFQQVGGQMQFAVHQVHILLDEVLFDGIADQQAERQQHRGRGRCEQQGQAQVMDVLRVLGARR
jgi:hypothetical protein